jgi:hypothetical protein
LIGAVLAVVLGAGLVLTVAPSPLHHTLPNVSHNDLPTYYQKALGRSGSRYVDIYRIGSEIHPFVGNATYRGEQLMMWNPHSQYTQLYSYVGLYYDGPEEIPSFPHLTRGARRLLEERKPAEVLFISTTGAGFSTALRNLAPFRPVVDKKAFLSSGPVHVHVWLINLRDFMR